MVIMISIILMMAMMIIVVVSVSIKISSDKSKLFVLEAIQVTTGKKMVCFFSYFLCFGNSQCEPEK